MEELLKSKNIPSKILVTDKWLIKNPELSKNFDNSLITIVSEEVLSSTTSQSDQEGTR